MSPIVSPRRPRERSHRPVLRVLGGHGEPSEPPAAAGDLDTAESREPALRIVADESREAAPVLEATSVLLAGADAGRRAILRAELGATLPPRTPFSEAEDIMEVLERAPSSRMVVLAGDLDDADAESLMRLLGRRHPLLPVISVGAVMPAVAGAHG
jgi:hypothetical protein